MVNCKRPAPNILGLRDRAAKKSKAVTFESSKPRVNLGTKKPDEAAKATNIANYHRFEMSKTKKGSAFLDKLAVAEVALSSVGEELYDGTKLSKLMKSTSANPAYRNLARSIYSTPSINYSTAISLFAGYDRSDLLPASSSTSADDN